MSITTSHPLTAKQEKILAVLEGALLGFGALQNVALVSPADFAEIMYRPTVDKIQQAVRDLMPVQWSSSDRPGIFEPIIVSFAGRDGINALVVEFSSAYVHERNEALPEHRH